MQAKHFDCRFSVGQEDGRSGSEWLVWVNEGKNDIYIAPERYDSALKVSLHEDGRAYGGVSSSAAKRMKFKKRKLEEWHVDRTRTAEPVTELFRIHVPHSDLRLQPIQASANMRWVAAHPQAQQTTISLFQFNWLPDQLLSVMSYTGFQPIIPFCALPRGLGLSIWFRGSSPDVTHITEAKQARPSSVQILNPDRGRMVVGGGCYDGVRCLWDLAADEFRPLRRIPVE